MIDSSNISGVAASRIREDDGRATAMLRNVFIAERVSAARGSEVGCGPRRAFTKGLRAPYPRMWIHVNAKNAFTPDRVSAGGR
jgi:hypothetical protein